LSARKRKYGKAIWLGLAVSTFFVWFAVRSIDAEALRLALKDINYWAVVASGAAVAMGIVCRSIRWRVIANSPSAEHSAFSRATNIGVLANMIFPARAGEVIRILALIKITSYKLPRALASAMIDRFVDVLVLLLSGLLVYLYIPKAAILERWLFALGAILFTGVMAIGLVFWRKDMFRKLGRVWLQRILRRWALKPEVFLSEFFRELKMLAHGRLPINLFGISSVIWCLDYLAVSSILTALHLSLPIEAALLLWVFLAASSALPSAPGYVGVYQVAAIFALSFYGVEASRAVAVALVLQAATLVVAILMASPILVSKLSKHASSPRNG
jgi:glycosyltransferase 2 family protein